MIMKKMIKTAVDCCRKTFACFIHLWVPSTFRVSTLDKCSIHGYLGLIGTRLQRNLKTRLKKKN